MDALSGEQVPSAAIASPAPRKTKTRDVILGIPFLILVAYVGSYSYCCPCFDPGYHAYRRYYDHEWQHALWAPLAKLEKLMRNDFYMLNASYMGTTTRELVEGNGEIRVWP